jgi:uncharacterized protein YaaW (UPF0174 family)
LYSTLEKVFKDYKDQILLQNYKTAKKVLHFSSNATLCVADHATQCATFSHSGVAAIKTLLEYL